MGTEARQPTALVADGAEEAPASNGNGRAPFPPEGEVYGRLFRQGYEFNFFQAVRLLERYFSGSPSPGQTSELRSERILFRPYPGLVFPAADLRAVEALEDPSPRVRLVLTFMGLYGVASPLPLYYYEELAAENPETDVLRDFLDIFNHRLYAYFYRAWRKYRPDVGHGVPGEDRNAERFLSVAGLGTRGAVETAPLPSPLRLAGFAALLSPHARHAEGLHKLLTTLLGFPVRIQENVPRWVPIRDRPRMGGSGFALGAGTVVGSRVRDVSGKFRIVVGPLDYEDYLTFLPNRENARLLAFLVRLYAPDYLDYDVELHLDTSKVPPARLGNRDIQLGLTIRLGKPRKEIVAHVMNYT